MKQSAGTCAKSRHFLILHCMHWNIRFNLINTTFQLPTGSSKGCG